MQESGLTDDFLPLQIEIYPVESLMQASNTADKMYALSLVSIFGCQIKSNQKLSQN
jgi:hypothetical protein